MQENRSSSAVFTLFLLIPCLAQTGDTESFGVLFIHATQIQGKQSCQSWLLFLYVSKHIAKLCSFLTFLKLSLPSAVPQSEEPKGDGRKPGPSLAKVQRETQESKGHCAGQNALMQQETCLGKAQLQWHIAEGTRWHSDAVVPRTK